MGELSVMGREGDRKLTWAEENETEVEAARTTFEKLVGKGYAAFRVNGQTDRVREFDSKAERLILVPPMAGG